MTLSEAISEAEKNAKQYEDRAEVILKQKAGVTGYSMDQANLYLQYAKDQRQIKEWLRELQRLRWMSGSDTD